MLSKSMHSNSFVDKNSRLYADNDYWMTFRHIKIVKKAVVEEAFLTN